MNCCIGDRYMLEQYRSGVRNNTCIKVSIVLKLLIDINMISKSTTWTKYL